MGRPNLSRETKLSGTNRDRKPLSLARGDAHTNSRRWLTSRRHSLCSNEHCRSSATSLVLPDQRYQCENIISIRHVQEGLEDEGLRNKIKASSGV